MSEPDGGAGRLPSPVGVGGKAPPYVRRDVSPIHLAELSSSNPVEGLDALERLDPFHDGLWRGGAGAWWTSHADVASRQTRWLAAAKRWKRLSPEQGADILMSRRHRADLIKMCAILLAWRTCSAQQLAALTGSPKMLGNGSLVHAAFAAGLIDIGAMPSPVGHDRAGVGLLVRLSRTSSERVWRDVIEPALTWTEWVAVTGGLGWEISGQYDRHNILSTELGLRAAEYLPVAQVLGERFSAHALLAYGLPGYRPEDIGNSREAFVRRGDLLIVRPDGLRIVVELTATAKSAEMKARNWAHLMLKAPMELSGFVVVFVCAVDPLNTSQTPQMALSDVAQGVSRATREVPGSAGNWTAERFAVVDWSEWFPGSLAVSNEFTQLSARQPTGPVESPWQDVSLMGLPLKPAKGFDPTSLIDNSAMLACGPHWLRPKAETQLWPYLFDGPIDDFLDVELERTDRIGGPRYYQAHPPARLVVGNEVHWKRWR